ncbi:DUF1292 domain-containing protein [Paenibacillus sp. 481]|nr:DUF1292 domain-containing protein [Paenibacillus sp. 481]
MTDEQGKGREYTLVAEFKLRDKAYAVLLPTGAKDAEPDLFQVVADGDGGFELESITDDEEWEEVMELYDEHAYADEFEAEK